MENRAEIGIVDTRNIVKTINEVYDYDLSNYALTSLKRRIERIIELHNIKNADYLILKLKNQEYFDQFLGDFLVETTEMFRDPSLWRWLRDNYFPEVLQLDTNFKIWIPDCVGGDELFSLCILLKESDMFGKVNVIASCINQLHIDKIKSGKTSIKKIDTNTENYKRFNGFGDFSIYYTKEDLYATRDISLLENVEFKILNVNKDLLPRMVNLILYRNHFIFFNQTLQDQITAKLGDSLKNSGVMTIGNKEMLGRQFLNDFVLINHSESVYKKR